MKTFFVSLLLVAASATAAQAQEHAKPHDTHKAQEAHNLQDKAKAETVATMREGEVLKRGAAFSADSPIVPFADVLKEPAKYAGKRVRIEGVVERVCQSEGCWMQIAPVAGATGIRVTFKDHSFFVPKDSKTLKFKAEGEFSVKVLSKEQVDHLVEDGAKIERKADGTADEIRFVATGVELWK